jgi:alkyl hydroperoxide reductase subunit AhpC
MKQPRTEGGIGKINYPLVADINKNISRSYGVLLNQSVALRGLFIIDDQGDVQHSTINNLGVGRNVDEVLRLVEAFQYTAKHGEVCPANWHRGEDSMKPDPEKSKDWFHKHGK